MKNTILIILLFLPVFASAQDRNFGKITELIEKRIFFFLPLLGFTDDFKKASIRYIENEEIKTKNCGNCGTSTKNGLIYITKGIGYTNRKGVEYIFYNPYSYNLTNSETVSFEGSDISFKLSDIRMTEVEFKAFIQSCYEDDADEAPTNKDQDTSEVLTVGAVTIGETVYPIGTDVPSVLDAIATANAVDFNCEEIMTCFEPTSLTTSQIIELMSVLDFSQLTQAQKDDLCSIVQFTVNSGTTATSTDNSGGEAVIDCDDILHFWNSDGAINVTTTEGSAVVDIALKISVNADNQIQILDDGLYVPVSAEIDGDVTNEIQPLTSADNSVVVTPNGIGYDISVNSAGGILKIENTDNIAADDSTNNYHEGRIGIGNFENEVVNADLHILNESGAKIIMEDAVNNNTLHTSYFEGRNNGITTSRNGFFDGTSESYEVMNYLDGYLYIGTAGQRGIGLSEDLRPHFYHTRKNVTTDSIAVLDGNGELSYILKTELLAGLDGTFPSFEGAGVYGFLSGGFDDELEVYDYSILAQNIDVRDLDFSVLTVHDSKSAADEDETIEKGQAYILGSTNTEGAVPGTLIIKGY